MTAGQRRRSGANCAPAAEKQWRVLKRPLPPLTADLLTAEDFLRQLLDSGRRADPATVKREARALGIPPNLLWKAAGRLGPGWQPR